MKRLHKASTRCDSLRHYAKMTRHIHRALGGPKFLLIYRNADSVGPHAEALVGHPLLAPSLLQGRGP